MTTMTAAPRPPHVSWHWALFYEGDEQYVEGVLGFVRDALAAGRPTFVAVPGPNAELLRRTLGADAARVRFADMRRVGRNPNCIIAAIQAFIDENRDRTVSFVGEPIWAGRTPAEIAEATRHEALINAAFEGTGAHVLCPYDVIGLAETVVADACRTHPDLLDRSGQRRSDRYEHPHAVWREVGDPAPVPADAERLTVTATELHELRQAAGRHATVAQLPDRRTDDLLLVVTELATNSIRHGDGSAAVALWTEPQRVHCQVHDAGTIDDPMVGRRAPRRDSTSGRGLWLVNQLSDLVQLHSRRDGTTVHVIVGTD